MEIRTPYKIWLGFSAVRNKATSLESQGFQGQLALFWCKDFGQYYPKSLHLLLERPSVPAEIRIVTMSEFHKTSHHSLFL